MSAAKSVRLLLVALVTLLLAAPAQAEGWKVRLNSYALSPDHLLAITKDNQTLFMLAHQSPLKVARQFPCTTGQSDGDKLVEGDLKTPEGVYFVGHRMPAGNLDYELYGGVAYSLNFPNPVDRIKGKTGSGIWIHGRGKSLAPRDTRGCVALNTDDLRSMEGDLKQGTPVIIAKDVSWSEEPGEAGTTAQALADNLRTWARDWSGRGDAYFSHYDQVKYAASEHKAFSAFVSYKRGIFASKPWIQVQVENVHVLPGPDYWVTTFDQYYRTVGMTNTVGKRFYWQEAKPGDGDWRIVGEEYTEASEDLEPKYLVAKTAEVRKMLEAWLASWRKADLKGYLAYYDAKAEQGKVRGREAIGDYKKSIWQSKPPVTVEMDSLNVSMNSQGLEARFVQTYRDASGYADRGLKTMVLAPEGDGWAILSEDWRALP